ncbi:MAG: hypothetical protein ACOCYB_11890 [Alkalispirochaeta sp.]
MKNVYVIPVVRSLYAALIIILFWGCATPEQTPPDWIRGSSLLTERQLLAYGRGDTEAEAQERAHEDAAAQITQLLVRDLEAQDIVVTRAVGEAVERRAAGRVESARPVESYRRRDTQGAVEQFLLYEYLPEDRNQDLTRIYETADLGVPTPRQSDPVPAEGESAAPTEDGSSPLQEVRTRLSGSVPEPAAERRRLLEEAQELAGDVDVSIEPQERTVALGEALAAGFSVAVRTADTGEPLADVSLRVEVRGPRVDGRRDTSELRIVTDQDGTAQIPVAAPALAGTTRIVVEPIWLADQLGPWETAVERSESQDVLSSIRERLRGRAAVRVTSQAPSIPTAMIVLDRDIAGNPIASSDTMRGMAREFSDTDFRIREVDLSDSDRRRLAEADSISVADLYDILPFDVLARMDRVIVGHAHILEFTEDDGFTVVVEVEAGAFDLRRDEVLTRISFEERITGSDARSAIRTAFQAAGRRLVRRIVPRLP